MNWISKIDRIVCLNLLKRTDRLLDFTEQMEKYQIPFERVAAIEDIENGARGLRDSVVRLLNEEIAKNTRHLLVFEDDAIFVEEPPLLHEYMNKVMEQIPENYHMVFLGCQLSTRPTRHSPNLLRVIKAFSTHSVLYSLQGMKEVLATNLSYPIDNHLVDHLQPQGHCYCTYPLLASQKPGISDIGGGHFMDWTPFIQHRFSQKIAEMGGNR